MPVRMRAGAGCKIAEEVEGGLMQAPMGDRIDDATTLRLLMAWLDLRPGQLAQTLGMTPGAVAHWLSGRTRPSPAMAQALLELAKKHEITFTTAGVPVPVYLLDGGGKIR